MNYFSTSFIPERARHFFYEISVYNTCIQERLREFSLLFGGCLSFSYTLPLFCPTERQKKEIKKKQWHRDWGTSFSRCFTVRAVGKNLFNVFSDEIWTGKLNYSLVCTALSDDNIVPSRPETQTTKRYFCRVGNCQRSTPLSCLCMHKEHQRLVSDSQMDDLNVTLARPQRQSGKETLGIERGGSFLCCHPQLLPFSLSLCLSFYRGFVCLILLSRSLTLFLPLSATVVTHSSFRSLSSSQRETHTGAHRVLPLPLSLVI